MVQFFSKPYREKYGITQSQKKLWNDLVICIPKTNTSRNLDTQIGLQLKNSSCRPQQVVGHT